MAQKTPAPVEDGAVLSVCGEYRYTLTRKGNNPAVFLMLNPSTADAAVNDRTINKCRHFSKELGYDGLLVVNLYAYRTPYPELLQNQDDPVGKHNLEHIRAMARVTDTVICGWGQYKGLGKKGHNPHALHIRRVMSILLANNCKVLCLGMNKDGSPKHPLYLRNDTQLISFTTGV